MVGIGPELDVRRIVNSIEIVAERHVWRILVLELGQGKSQCSSTPSRSVSRSVLIWSCMPGFDNAISIFEWNAL